MLPTVCLKPGLGDETPIADDAHAWKAQVQFAVANKLSNEPALVLDKGLSTAEVHFLHAFTKE